MIKVRTTPQQLQEAACEVIRCNAALSPNQLVIELAAVEERRQQLGRMLRLCRDMLERPINEGEYQTLMDYLYLQAAKHNVDSAELETEVGFKFVVEDLRTLPERSLWDAIQFIRAYCKGEVDA